MHTEEHGHPLCTWAVPGLCLPWDTLVSGIGRLFQVGCSFSFPEASGAALIDIAVGGTKAVLQLKEIIGVRVDVTCGGRGRSRTGSGS